MRLLVRKDLSKNLKMCLRAPVLFVRTVLLTANRYVTWIVLRMAKGKGKQTCGQIINNYLLEKQTLKIWNRITHCPFLVSQPASQPCFSRSQKLIVHPDIFLEIRDEPVMLSNLLSLKWNVFYRRALAVLSLGDSSSTD